MTNQAEQLEFKRICKDLGNQSRNDCLPKSHLDSTLGGDKVFTKVVPCSYRKDVYAHLATRAMAPRFYGISSVQDSGSVAVIEHLGDDWTTIVRLS